MDVQRLAKPDGRFLWQLGAPVAGRQFQVIKQLFDQAPAGIGKFAGNDKTQVTGGMCGLVVLTDITQGDVVISCMRSRSVRTAKPYFCLRARLRWRKWLLERAFSSSRTLPNSASNSSFKNRGFDMAVSSRLNTRNHSKSAHSAS